ncbi:MAG: hypothetical protein EAZ74_00790 [Alphaproteobacteria bacterium]|nr:MAG: hypothetical protein EAY76_01995 [Alphaproteobacteria bacterium]TAF15843.1 MAG: hypothetical protein EAZ74_00790 [Alphaproteobacteria bacterium]TAF77259.1 MAG: hypothetical protein EAZ52_01625 [Alphaproteobacteria bacterium]
MLSYQRFQAINNPSLHATVRNGIVEITFNNKPIAKNLAEVLMKGGGTDEGTPKLNSFGLDTRYWRAI